MLAGLKARHGLAVVRRLRTEPNIPTTNLKKVQITPVALRSPTPDLSTVGKCTVHSMT